MKRGAQLLVFVMFLTLSAVVFAGTFKVYPGARLYDVMESKQPEAVNKISRTQKIIIFTTDDLFENVVAFYRGTAREYRTPGSSGKPTKLASGQEIKEAYFILDDAADIMTSKHWIKIQRPYLGKGQSREGFHGKEVTAIIEEDKRSYP
jgi:hypothetical protein